MLVRRSWSLRFPDVFRNVCGETRCLFVEALSIFVERIFYEFKVEDLPTGKSARLVFPLCLYLALSPFAQAERSS